MTATRVGRQREFRTPRRRGLRAIALFEAAKGLGAVTLAAAAWLLFHGRPESSASHLVQFLHLAPRGHLARQIIGAATYLRGPGYGLVALLVAAYATARLVEAAGLWRQRPWAEWFGIISGTIYIPFEIYEIARHRSPLTIAVFVLNVLVVGYLVSVRLESRTRHAPRGSLAPT